MTATGTPRARARLLPLAALAAIALGAALRWPALWVGFHSDDYQQLAMLRGDFLLVRPAWDLFWFGPRSPAELARLTDFGFDPWWTAEGHRLAMFRPLASLLIWLDQRLFGDAAVLWHLHSLLWWALLVSAVAVLFARLLPPAVAALALLLFALDQSHNVPIAWLANRSPLVCATFGVLGLLLHLRARDADRPRRALLYAGSALLFALSLAAGEYAFGLLAYLVAYELFGARDPLAARARRLLPAAAAAALYLAVRAHLGHGVADSGLYNSLADPGRYLLDGAARSGALLADLIFGVPASWFQSGTPLRNLILQLELFDPATWSRLPDWRSFHTAIGGLALLATWLLVRWLSRQGVRELADIRWLVLGSLLALPALASTHPAARLLGAPAIGVCALLASAIVAAVQQLRQRPLAVAIAAAALAVHVPYAAYDAHADAARMRDRTAATRRWTRTAEIPRDARGVEIVLVSASDFATGVNLPWIRRWQGLPLPRSYRLLSGARAPHQLVGVDDRTFDVLMLGSDFRDAFAGSVYRASEHRLGAGAQVRLHGMQVEVIAVRGGEPSWLRVRFDRRLDDPQLVFLHALPGRLRRFSPPAPGEQLLLPWPAQPWDPPQPAGATR